MADSACLESTCTGNGTMGSNPILSATEKTVPCISSLVSRKKNAKDETEAYSPTESALKKWHRKGAGPCAAESCEPRQVRKEATVSRRVCVPQDHLAPVFLMGMLKKTASDVLAILPCSRTPSTLRSSKWLRPCWTDPSERLRACFFEHSLQLLMSVSSWALIGHWSKVFNSP